MVVVPHLQPPAARASVSPARRLGRVVLVAAAVLLAPVAGLFLLLAALLGPHLWHQHQAHVAERALVGSLALPATWQRTGSTEGAADLGKQPWLDVGYSDPAGTPSVDVSVLVAALRRAGCTEVEVTPPGSGGNPVGSAPTWLFAARHGAQVLHGGVAGGPDRGATVSLDIDVRLP